MTGLLKVTEGELGIDKTTYLTTESDPVFVAHPAYGLTTQDMTDIGNLSGTNTGDQDLSGYLTLTTYKTQGVVLDGDLASHWHKSAYKKIPVIDLGSGITVTRIVVQCSAADPTTELDADIKYCDAQGTGAFPGANATVIKAIDTTTGNYDSGVFSTAVGTGKHLYLQLNADPVDNGVIWTITIYYTVA